jgi:hypothetical protein
MSLLERVWEIFGTLTGFGGGGPAAPASRRGESGLYRVSWTASATGEPLVRISLDGADKVERTGTAKRLTFRSITRGMWQSDTQTDANGKFLYRTATWDDDVDISDFDPSGDWPVEHKHTFDPRQKTGDSWDVR